MPKSHVHAAHQAGGPLDDAIVDTIASTMQALTTQSRVRLLYALLDGERAVGELADLAGLSPAATSQQLRVLRHLGLVSARRAGQSVRYRLYDEHLATLLREIVNHAEHAFRGWEAPAADGKKTAR